MNDSEDLDVESLDSYTQLPKVGDSVFRIGDQLVRFTCQADDGELAGWVVSTSDPEYSGFLAQSSETVMGENGPERSQPYGYSHPGGSGAPTVNIGPHDVTIGEFKQIFFGVNRE